MRWIGVILGLAISVNNALACYNDSDTYLTELRDNLDITNAIIGRFTLYPPEYYKKRIEIQLAILKKNPNDLDAYDNLAVAYDRIGEGNKAIQWIEEKRKHLGSNPGNHLYTTEANEGTFFIVRWIRGHKPGDFSDANRAEKYVEKALQYNPNGHFGREFSQLYCIRAMIACGKEKDWMPLFTSNLVKIAYESKIDRRKLRFGIAGMMVLGAAWNSPMFIQSIAELVPEEGQVASLCKAKFRTMKISGENQDIESEFPIRAASTTHGNDFSIINQLLKNGTEYQENIDQWVTNKLAEGKHPDIDKDFWTGYTEVPAIPKEKLANSTIFSRTGTFLLNSLVSGLLCVILIPTALCWIVVRGMRRRQKIKRGEFL